MAITQYSTIQLKIRKPYFENYLRWVFNSQEGDIKVNRDEILGKFLFSMARTSDIPIKVRNQTGIVKLIMPSHICDDRSKYRSIYYSVDDENHINDYIEACAFMDLRMMVQTAKLDMKMDRKTVFEIYSEMIFGENKYEALKKYEYRRRKKALDYLRVTAKALCM
ncbi:MAG TPA: hypothetical protein PKH58_01295 [Paludibacteraceae bacterium]|nr:hypothetical protein [Paludibacteraceae bacterium]